MKDDLIISEVRAMREALARPFHYDINAIMQDAMRRERLGTHEIISFPSRTPINTRLGRRRELTHSEK
jgi:hypothetical protein